jgi:hypothetical protein
MSKIFSHKERIKILLQYWGLGLQQQLCVAFDLATAVDYQATLELQRDGNATASNKINNWKSAVSKLLNRDLSSADVKKVSKYLASKFKGLASAPDFENVLEGPDAEFFYFLGTSGLETGGAAEQRVASVGGDTIEAPGGGGGDKSGDGHLGNSLAPNFSSGYVGIRWPYSDALGQHFGAAYQEIFGEALPRDKSRRGPREQVFFFYRLGFEQLKTVQLGDGAIRIKDQNLGLVIRRIPARIHYEAPFDGSLTRRRITTRAKITFITPAELFMVFAAG